MERQSGQRLDDPWYEAFHVLHDEAYVMTVQKRREERI